jgi:hypothetical protein
MSTFEETMQAKQQAFENEQKQWQAYFLNNNNKGLDFIKDMEKALKAGFIDHDDATLCLMGLNAAIKDLLPLIERIKGNSRQGEMERWRQSK